MSPFPPDVWYDEAAGPVVRPYAMTRGRTEPVRGRFDLITLVVARAGIIPTNVTPEQARILRMCESPLSTAEIAAYLDLPAGTVRVLLGDLLNANLIETREPAMASTGPSEELLEAVLAGLRAL
jgi:DNA-binding NarL/FixJ family response regulator